MDASRLFEIEIEPGRGSMIETDPRVASGAALDRLAEVWILPRRDGETDAALRARLLRAIGLAA